MGTVFAIALFVILSFVSCQSSPVQSSPVQSLNANQRNATQIHSDMYNVRCEGTRRMILVLHKRDVQQYELHVFGKGIWLMGLGTDT